VKVRAATALLAVYSCESLEIVDEIQKASHSRNPKAFCFEFLNGYLIR